MQACGFYPQVGRVLPRPPNDAKVGTPFRSLHAMARACALYKLLLPAQEHEQGQEFNAAWARRLTLILTVPQAKTSVVTRKDERVRVHPASVNAK